MEPAVNFPAFLHGALIEETGYLNRGMQLISTLYWCIECQRQAGPHTECLTHMGRIMKASWISAGNCLISENQTVTTHVVLNGQDHQIKIRSRLLSYAHMCAMLIQLSKSIDFMYPHIRVLTQSGIDRLCCVKQLPHPEHIYGCEVHCEQRLLLGKQRTSNDKLYLDLLPTPVIELIARFKCESNKLPAVLTGVEPRGTMRVCGNCECLFASLSLTENNLRKRRSIFSWNVPNKK